jgi:hypothetical protein
MTSQGLMCADNSGLIVVMAGKQSNMATVVGECVAVRANEDPSSFQYSYTGLREVWQSSSNGNNPLSSTSL